MLERCHLLSAKSVTTPMMSSSSLSKNVGSLIPDPSEYRSIAGALQYVFLTRPNIAYVVNRIYQFMHMPTDVHYVALKRTLRYLSNTSTYGLFIKPSDQLSIMGYADVN